MKAFSEKRPFLFALAVTFIVMVLMIVCFNYVQMLIFPEADAITGHAFFSLVQLALSIMIILIARHIGIANGWFSAKGTVKGLLLGWICFIWAIGFFIIQILITSSEDFITPKPWPLFAVTVAAFTTGLIEEVLIRGFVLNILLKKRGQTKKDILSACWISSALFGAIHLLNIGMGASVIITLGQVLYATLFGMFFAAIYIRTKSLWAPIILHAVFDLQSFIMDALVSSQALDEKVQQEMTLTDEIVSSLIPVVLLFPFVIVALFLLRKKKIGDAHEALSNY